MRAISHHRILVVDDDEDDRYFIDRSFRELGWAENIKLFHSGESLFRYLSALADPDTYPALILLDYRMPKAGAEDLLPLLKQHTLYTHIPVAVYSTEMNEALSAKLKALGAAACYTKTWNTTGNLQLAAALRHVAQQQAAA